MTFRVTQKLVVACSVFVLLLGASVANARYYTKKQTFTGSGVSGGAGGSFTAEKWDLGQPLRGMRVTLTITTNGGTYSGDSEESTSIDITALMGAYMTLSDEFAHQWFDTPTAGSGITAIGANYQDFTLSADDDGFPPDFGGSDYFSMTGDGGSGSNNSDLSTGLADYVGVGETFDFDWSGDKWGSYMPTAYDVLAGTSGEEVDYDWEAEVLMTANPVIPEPASLAMLVLGGVCFLRRRVR